MTYHHSMESLHVDNYHVDLVREIFQRHRMEFNPNALGEPIVLYNGPQVIVVHRYEDGPAEVDTISVIAVYIPHDGQCTVCVNHMDGMATLDNSDLMFPKKE